MLLPKQVYNSYQNVWKKIDDILKTTYTGMFKVMLKEFGSIPDKCIYMKKWYPIKDEKEFLKYFELSRKPLLDEIQKSDALQARAKQFIREIEQKLLLYRARLDELK